jgi:hypothetical protein
MAKVVVSYSHKDEALRKELEAHLAPLRREGLIDIWHDRRIVAGQPLDAAIDSHFAVADVILILVSSDFLNSDYCYDIELRRAMERHNRGEAIVIPVILRQCDWKRMPFGHLLAAPTDGIPITSWQSRDEAFHEVARAIRASIGRLGTQHTTRQEQPPHQAVAPSAPRSSHLRLPKTFSEKDKDDFLEEAFNYITQFFENSLAELERENRGVETKLRRLDTARFTAITYRGGRAASRCTIWMAGRDTFVGGIGYVENDSGMTNSFNESLSVESDEQTLYLKPQGIAFVGQGRIPDKLDVEAGAAFLWSLFIRRLREAR